MLDFSGSGDGLLYVDMAAVSQVYENLVSNAVRYGKNQVKVTSEFKDGVLSITVADDSPGFTPEALQNAAEPYFRDEKDISDAAHFGIGLYICRLLVKNMAGRCLLKTLLAVKLPPVLRLCRAQNNFLDL